MEETGPTGAVISTDLRCLGSVPLLPSSVSFRQVDK
jgi:hypothetical protein